MSIKSNFLLYSTCVLAGLSLIGSSLTLLSIYRMSIWRQQHHLRRNPSHRVRNSGAATKALTTYHRLLIGMSMCDILLSIGLGFGPLLQPVDDANHLYPGAHGTTGTCTLQGFLIQMGMGSFLYSLMLIVYSIVVIRYKKTEAWIKKWLEPFLHFFPVFLYFGTAVTGVVLKVFNAGGTLCFVVPLPLECIYDPTVECIRPSNLSVFQFYANWLVAYPLLGSTILLVVALFVVIATIIEKYTRFGFSIDGQRNANTDEQAKQLIVQCLLYTISFVNVMIWGSMSTIYRLVGQPLNGIELQYWIRVLNRIFFPLQGAFNFLIFIRPRYMAKRQQYIHHGRWYALRAAVLGSGAATSNNVGSETSIQRYSESRFNDDLAIAGTDGELVDGQECPPDLHPDSDRVHQPME